MNWQEKICKLNCVDMSLVKLSAVFGGLVIFKAIKIIWGWDVLTVSIWWLLVIMVVLAIRPGMKVFAGKKQAQPESPEQKSE